MPTDTLDPVTRDWFRNETWTAAVREEFERRLARARPSNRPQYLRIQGVHLERAGDVESARELWVRTVQSDPSHDLGRDRFAAMEHLADSFKRSDSEQAARWYRLVLAENSSLSGTSWQAELSLAETLVAAGDVLGARQSLADWRARGESKTPADLVREQLVLLELAEVAADRDAARIAARRALEAAAMPSPFANHPDVGIAKLDAATRKRLNRLARGRRFRR